MIGRKVNGSVWLIDFCLELELGFFTNLDDILWNDFTGEIHLLGARKLIYKIK